MFLDPQSTSIKGLMVSIRWSLGHLKGGWGLLVAAQQIICQHVQNGIIGSSQDTVKTTKPKPTTTQNYKDIPQKEAPVFNIALKASIAGGSSNVTLPNFCLRPLQLDNPQFSMYGLRLKHHTKPFRLYMILADFCSPS